MESSNAASGSDSLPSSRPLTAPEALAIAKTKGVNCGVRETFAGDGGDDVDLNVAASRIQAIVRAREGSMGRRLRAAGAQRARAAAAKAQEKWQSRSGANRSGGVGADARPHSDVVLLADSVPDLPNGFGRGRTPGLERNISTESGSPPGERAGPYGPGSPGAPSITTDANAPTPQWRHDPKTGGLVRTAAYGGSASAEGLVHAASPVTPLGCGSGQPSPTSASSATGGFGGGGGGGGGGAGGVSSIPGAPTPSPVQTDAESAAMLRRRVDLLERALVATQAALDTERSQCAQWKRCMCEILNGIGLNGRMNAKHELKVAQKLEAALRKQEHVEAVRYIRCVFPAAAANAPNLQLKRYESLQWSRWDVVWSPSSWSIELCLEGHSLFVPFKLVCRVRDLKLRGEMTACFPPDLGHVTFSFVELPEVKFEIDSETSIGSVPTPLQRGVSKLIKHQLTKWMSARVVAPNSMRIHRKIQGSGGDGGGGGDGSGGAGDEAQGAAAGGGGGGDGESSAGGSASTHGNRGATVGADAAGGDTAGSDADAAAAAPVHVSGPTEEELRVAILAALHSKDSRPRGASRARRP